MTVGALVVFVVSCIMIGLFGLYASYHREEDQSNHKSQE
jgi:hypothetical protein